MLTDNGKVRWVAPASILRTRLSNLSGWGVVEPFQRKRRPGTRNPGSWEHLPTASVAHLHGHRRHSSSSKAKPGHKLQPGPRRILALTSDTGHLLSTAAEWASIALALKPDPSLWFSDCCHATPGPQALQPGNTAAIRQHSACPPAEQRCPLALPETPMRHNLHFTRRHPIYLGSPGH